MTLSWSAVICTLNRQEILKQSLPTVFKQTRLPQQIIVVDASDDWMASKTEILESVAGNFPEIEWIYMGSQQKSLTYQRNQGLKFCKSDIVFFPDDDSFLYPDCAEEIMRVYEQDEAGEVGGVMATLAELPPSQGHSTAEESEDNDAEDYSPGLKARLGERLAQFWYQEHLFLPYDGEYHSHNVAALAHRIPVFSAILFHGCRMTFRTAAVKEVGGFEEVLIKSALAEDCDLSYRVSRNFALVAAEKARIFHEQTEVARINRYKNTALVVLNGAALFLLHTRQEKGKGFTVYRFALGRLLLEFVRDCAKPQRGFPNFRGAWYAVASLPQLLQCSRGELRNWYPEFQAKLYGS